MILERRGLEIGSVYVNYGTLPAEHVYSSADWSPAELLREKKNWQLGHSIGG